MTRSRGLKIWHVAAVLGLASTPLLSWAADGRIPDEFETTGGHSLGFGNGGTAAVAGQGSVRNNPAMLAVEKQYALSASYHWPSFGRDFYQAGVVDSKTSPVAAGFTYTSSRETYATPAGKANAAPTPDDLLHHSGDSPIKYRAALGLAQAFSHFALGIGGQYVEGYDSSAGDALSKGATFGFGLAGLFTPELRFGAAVENLGNTKVTEFAPRTYRAGLAYTLVGGQVTTHLDYSQRQRIRQELPPRSASDTFEGVFGVSPKTGLTATEASFLEKPEQMLTASFSVGVQSLVRILGSYGYELGGTERRMVSGGVAIVNNNYALAYLLSKPYLDEAKLHHALSLSLQVAL